MTYKRYLLAAAPAVLLAGCGTGADPEDTLETVRLTEKAQQDAIAADDADGVMRHYEGDTELVLPGAAPVRGPDAIRPAIEALLADSGLKLDVTPGAGWAASSGDLAITSSNIQYTTADASGAEVTVPVVNQKVWRRASGATWKIVADHNTVVPQNSVVSAE